MPKTSLRLTTHFNLAEFLRSSVIPEVAFYQPTMKEVDNVQRLAQLVLEPLRIVIGKPILISGSMRPESLRDSKGRSFYEALKARGYYPSADSDHIYFLGTDFQIVGGTQGDYLLAYKELQRNPHVRQVILYYGGNPGMEFVDHIHVSVIAANFPRERGTDFAFATRDGKRIDVTV